MRGLLQHNLLYFGCSCAFLFGLAFTDIFFPFPVVHMIAEFIPNLEVMPVTYSAAGIRSLFKHSWSHECTGTSGDRIVPLQFVASPERICPSQCSWRQLQMLFDGALPSKSPCS
ncbi:hypothetical protein EDB19DRAFT_1678549 [Suillus lakei]|nr:hypothetical protein EDB19DRAFT_1678549 [Suillus lakei]